MPPPLTSSYDPRLSPPPSRRSTTCGPEVPFWEAWDAVGISVPVSRPEEVSSHVSRHFTTTLVAIAHGLTPVKAGPNARIINFARHCFEIVIRPPSSNEVRDR